MTKARKQTMTVGQEVLQREKRVNEATKYILGAREVKEGDNVQEPAQKAAHILKGIMLRA